MKQRKRYVVPLAAVALIALGFLAGRESVAPAHTSQQEARVRELAGGHPGSYSPEAERLSALSAPELRSTVDARSRELARVQETLRRAEEDEERTDPEAITFLEDAVLDRISALDGAYDVLAARVGLAPEDEISRLRDVDVAALRRALLVAREQRDGYAAFVDSGHPAQDASYRDELAILDAGVRMAEALLAESEARLRQAEHEAARLRAGKVGADAEPG